MLSKDRTHPQKSGSNGIHSTRARPNLSGDHGWWSMIPHGIGVHQSVGGCCCSTPEGGLGKNIAVLSPGFASEWRRRGRYIQDNPDPTWPN